MGLEELKNNIKKAGRIAVAYSGGVDSTFLLYMAHELLGENVLAITLMLHGMPKEERNLALEFCHKNKIRQITYEVDELAIEGFKENPPDRCYICKKAIFKKAVKIALENDYKTLADGSNYDDLKDYRPGMKALRELNVVSPLLEAHITKGEIRNYSKKYNLNTWDAPSSPCLSSRIPYGEIITEEKINMIEESEKYLKNLGFTECRVRTHGNLARIEINKESFHLLEKPSLRNEIDKKLKEIGYKYVSVDLIGFRSGSLNEVL